MKNLFLLSLIAISIGLSQAGHAAMIAAPSVIKDIKALDFSRRVTVEINNDNSKKIVVIHQCEPTEIGFGNDERNYEVIGSIQHCAVNLMYWKVNQFYFFKKNNKTYFRQVKLIQSNSYEVLSIDSDRIELGAHVESTSTTKPETNFSKF